jgi:hypothetical protein
MEDSKREKEGALGGLVDDLIGDITDKLGKLNPHVNDDHKTQLLPPEKLPHVADNSWQKILSLIKFEEKKEQEDKIDKKTFEFPRFPPTKVKTLKELSETHFGMKHRKALEGEESLSDSEEEKTRKYDEESKELSRRFREKLSRRDNRGLGNKTWDVSRESRHGNDNPKTDEEKKVKWNGRDHSGQRTYMSGFNRSESLKSQEIARISDIHE